MTTSCNNSGKRILEMDQVLMAQIQNLTKELNELKSVTESRLRRTEADILALKQKRDGDNSRVNEVSDAVTELANRLERYYGQTDHQGGQISAAQGGSACLFEGASADIAEPLVSKQVSVKPHSKSTESSADIRQMGLLWPDFRLFTGEPNVCFTSWIVKFEDLCSTMSPKWNDKRKLLNLKLLLDGNARQRYEELSNEDKSSYAKAVAKLTEIYNSPQKRMLARQNMSTCKQLQGESALAFADRLSLLVNQALEGQPDNVIQKRLLEEFVDRLSYPLSFHVSIAEPKEFNEARWKAQAIEAYMLAGIPQAGTTAVQRSCPLQTYIPDRASAYCSTNNSHMEAEYATCSEIQPPSNYDESAARMKAQYRPPTSYWNQ